MNETLNLTRRSFVGGLGAAAGLAGVTWMGVSLPGIAEAVGDDPDAAEEVFSVACCGNCGGIDTLECHVRNGVVCDICNHPLPDRNRENICQRGISNIFRLYGERRLQYPRRRKEGTKRGEGQWEQISWDEAIKEICDKWKGYQAEFGNSSVVFTGGSGSQRADSNPESGYMYRLANYMNAAHMIEDQDQICMTSLSEMVGAGLTAWGNDWNTLSEAENIIAWGCNVTEQSVVRYRHVGQAQAAGARLTVIDPNFTITASKADEYVPVRPASDGLLIIGMMRYILRNKLQKDGFLAEMTVAPLLVKDADGMYLRKSDLGQAEAGSDDDALLVVDSRGEVGVLGEVKDPAITGVSKAEGVAVKTAYDLLVDRVLNSEWTDEQICELTEVPQETIERLAQGLVDKKTTLMIAYGPNHYTNGQTFYYNMVALMMLSGNWGEPGRGIVGGDVSFLFAPGADITSMTYPEDAPGISYEFYNNHLDQLLTEGRLGTDDPCTPKALYIQGANYLGNQPHRSRNLELFDQIDFIVVADIEETDTTKYADIVLPVCHWWESWGYTNTEGYMRISEKIHEPLYESKSDLDIFNLLLAGMGFGDKVIETEDFFTAAFDNDDAKAIGLSWERLKKEKVIETLPEGFVPCNGAGGEFNTATGRAQFYREGCRPNPDFGQEWDYMKERLPYWEPPTEAWPTSEAAKKFPIQFITERPKFKVHSMFSYAPNLLEVAPEPVLFMNPTDAESRGLRTDDYARVYNDRGFVVAKVAINNGTRAGMAMMDHGWQDEQFADGHYQTLTGHHTGVTHANCCYNDTMVEIEKA